MYFNSKLILLCNLFLYFSFVPYCTSDIWTGRRAEPQHGSKFTFMGSIVIKQVIRELLTMGLSNANALILSGSRYYIILYYLYIAYKSAQL